MQRINETLDSIKENIVIDNQYKVNPRWERAKTMCQYCKLPEGKGMIVFILKLCKKKKNKKVFALQSWLKDMEHVDRNRIQGLLVWKLKGGVVDKQLF